MKTRTLSTDRDSYRRFKICFSMGHYGDKTNIDAGCGIIGEHSVTVFIAKCGDRARGTNQDGDAQPRAILQNSCLPVKF